MSSVRSVRTVRRRAGTGLLAGLVLFVLLTAACSSDTRSQVSESVGQATVPSGGGGDDSGSSDGSGGDGSSSGDASTDGSASDGSGTAADDELSDEDWIILIVLGLAAFAVIIFATSAATRHKDKKVAARSNLDNQLGELVGTSRWIHDSGCLEVVQVDDPDRLQSTSGNLRSRMMDLENQISVLSNQTGDNALNSSLRNLGQSVAGLRSAMDGLVSARLGPDAGDQQALIDSATQTFNQRRGQLGAAIDPVAAAMR